MIPSLQLTPICRLKLGQFLQDWKLRTLNCIKTACLYTLLLLNIQQPNQQKPFCCFFLKYFIFRLLRFFHRNDESMLLYGIVLIYRLLQQYITNHISALVHHHCFSIKATSTYRAPEGWGLHKWYSGCEDVFIYAVDMDMVTPRWSNFKSNK